MDIGGFRDMHRHRRCTQIIQGFTALHGYENAPACRRTWPPKSTFSPKPAFSPNTAPPSSPLTGRQRAVAAKPVQRQKPRNPPLYLLPLATRIRASSKWTSPKPNTSPNSAPAPAGHFSYRRVAWEMYLALKRQHPTLARHIRVTDFTQPIDIFQR